VASLFIDIKKKAEGMSSKRLFGTNSVARYSAVNSANRCFLRECAECRVIERNLVTSV
jgi:hypothetical protein